ncbi:hypothetical protein FHX37_4621 [Haloactinospora alba]|uniref:Holin n=1 Tax=Haloactinospora alba TaxID=405555 RepID=A0A543N2M6_9ACTN|nr:hypothetical protein [Haloactinospora alba]TQN26083.1 hypothetical protein FHX37_4621 [Haloactinospora alba]
MARIEKKVTASTASAAAVTVLVFVAGQLGMDVQQDVAAAAVTLVAAGAGWLAPHTKRPELEG